MPRMKILFTRAVSIGNPREFIQVKKQEQEVAEGCKRRIKNSITCWNYLYLSQKLRENDLPEKHEPMLQSIANGSVVSWQHINLLGEYDFSEEKIAGFSRYQAPKINDLNGEKLVGENCHKPIIQLGLG